MSRTGWWHGGPRIDGDALLPPVLTGAEMLRDGCETADDSDAYDRGYVYLVNDRTAALFYAAVWPDAWVYEVLPPIDGVEDDPDAVVAPGSTLRMVRCESARIMRRERVSNHERNVIKQALGVNLS